MRSVKDIEEAAALPPPLRPALDEACRRLEALYGNRLRHVVLYGSQARGDARPDSDVDVLVVLSESADGHAEFKRLAAVEMTLF